MGALNEPRNEIIQSLIGHSVAQSEDRNGPRAALDEHLTNKSVKLRRQT